MDNNTKPTTQAPVVVTTRNGLKVSGLVLTFKGGKLVGSNLPKPVAK